MMLVEAYVITLSLGWFSVDPTLHTAAVFTMMITGLISLLILFLVISISIFSRDNKRHLPFLPSSRYRL